MNCLLAIAHAAGNCVLRVYMEQRLSRRKGDVFSRTLAAVLIGGGAQRSIKKYKEKYNDLFPETHVKVIETSIRDLCFRSSKTKQKRLTTLPVPRKVWCAENRQCGASSGHCLRCTLISRSRSNGVPAATGGASQTDVEAIQSMVQANGRILLHVFSEDGSNKACKLAETACFGTVS
jgi:hypothetical protein